MTSVLVVEDDVTFRSSIGRELAMRGFEVQLASAAEEAIDILGGATFDVLLTDLRLGGRDGIDLLKRARALAPATRTVLMSGFATARDYQRAIELGAVRVLCKPFTSAELSQAIEHARDCSSGYSGSMHGLSLIDVLQLYQFGRRSLVLNVVGSQHGQILLREGSFVHATCGSRVGEAALVALLSAASGVLRTEPLPTTYPVTIQRAPQAVLLDCLRVIDEGGATTETFSVEDNEQPADPSTELPAEPAQTPEQLELTRGRLHAQWHALLEPGMTVPGSVEVVGFDIAAGTSTHIHGTGAPDSSLVPFKGLVSSLRDFCGSARGVAHTTIGPVQVAAVWDDARRFAFLITDVVATAAGGAWFRAFAHAIARGTFSTNA